jgi:hypothetical protein
VFWCCGKVADAGRTLAKRLPLLSISPSAGPQNERKFLELNTFSFYFPLIFLGMLVETIRGA